MGKDRCLKTIAHIHTDFPTKFGIPRQSGLAEDLRGEIVFEPDYRDPSALRGIEGFSHIWLIWGFSENIDAGWSPTVRPPRLGGNERRGVFATRSPFRPNPIGLSSVRLDGIEKRRGLGTVLLVSGVDMMDNTPIYDIKPYIPFVDSHPEASEGFASSKSALLLKPECSETLLSRLPESRRKGLLEALSQNPRPAYQNDDGRIYGFEFSGFDIRFTTDGSKLTVSDIVPLEKNKGKNI